ncbi:hypothetical protein BC833DRAFT_597997 [Globomyces pollinis-pini]|nr:hypothetical protein BC833DRAFT_597997 [Globomyces pollinis-pini]
MSSLKRHFPSLLMESHTVILCLVQVMVLAIIMNSQSYPTISALMIITGAHQTIICKSILKVIVLAILKLTNYQTFIPLLKTR